MNQYSINQFKKYGGEKLIGTSLLDCHFEHSKSKLKQMLKDYPEKMYTTEEDVVRKIILQGPCRVAGEFRSIVEISFKLSSGMPNMIR